MTQEHNSSVLSRRSALKGIAGMGGGIALASFAGALGVSAAEGDDDPQTIGLPRQNPLSALISFRTG